MRLPNLSLILGGAASGKSAFAENLLLRAQRPAVYIATAQAFDAEMEAKIAAHQQARGPGWRLIEAPTNLPAALASVQPNEAVLIDCATLWLSNLLLADADTNSATTALITALTTCPAPIVIVSNETGQGVVPDNALARRFRNAQGQLNQTLAAQAELAVLVIAGLPMVLKGTIPS
ncbi:MAG: bifunctional adenosylcobinamide kinase/adenosylcobinamide-phosphate guanylyltransferase [Rhodobacteraceae bacterium]|nr:bifunctional adenosylcobinamide kinase/adenosylcobinamide-phosphate guanylyltransferase [Paracoccaceae bacterium]